LHECAGMPMCNIIWRCTVNLKETGQASQTPRKSPPRTCTHSRLISDSVSEEEHEAGMVRCVECGSIIPNPHFQQDDKEA
jgi:hypothetical protein